jgi:hypothetical protein
MDINVKAQSIYTGAYRWALIEQTSHGAVLRFDSKQYTVVSLGAWPFPFKTVEIISGKATILLGEADEEYPGASGAVLVGETTSKPTFRVFARASLASGLGPQSGLRLFGIQNGPVAGGPTLLSQWKKRKEIKRLLLTLVGGASGGTIRIGLLRGTGFTNGLWNGPGTDAIGAVSAHDLSDGAAEAVCVQRGLDLNAAAVGLTAGANETQIDGFTFAAGGSAVIEIYTEEITSRPLVIRAGSFDGIGVNIGWTVALTSQLDAYLSGSLTEE